MLVSRTIHHTSAMAKSAKTSTPSGKAVKSLEREPRVLLKKLAMAGKRCLDPNSYKKKPKKKK